jgi:hypothetical protein
MKPYSLAGKAEDEHRIQVRTEIQVGLRNLQAVSMARLAVTLTIVGGALACGSNSSPTAPWLLPMGTYTGTVQGDSIRVWTMTWQMSQTGTSVSGISVIRTQFVSSVL